MARFLALDWDHQQLLIVSATVRAGRAHIQRAVVWKEEQSPSLAEAEAQGKLLRERLKAAGIAPAPVLVCLGRERIILKEVRYPAVPEAEEAAVVRFQAVKELSEPEEELVIDYTSAGEPLPTGEQRAFAVAVRRELLATYQKLCHSAGLKLLALTPRPFGSIACLKHGAGATALTPAPEPPHAVVALLTVAERGAEFCIARGEQLLLARTLATGPALTGEIRRNLAMYASQAAHNPVRALYVAAGDDQEMLRGRLQDLAGFPTHPFDPFAGAESVELPADQRSAFAGAVGLLHLQAQRRPLPINFVQPRQPKPPRDPNRKRILIAVAAGVVLFLGAVGFGYSQLAERDRKLETLFLQKMELDRQLIPIEEEAKRIKALDDWAQSEIVWLEELHDLTARFPDLNTIRLTGLTGNPLTRGAKDKHVAKMTLTGITTDDYKAIEALMKRLVEERYYDVDAKKVNRNTGVDRFRFRQQFTVPVDIAKRPPDQYVLPLDEPAPDEKTKGGVNRPRRRGGRAPRSFLGGERP